MVAQACPHAARTFKDFGVIQRGCAPRRCRATENLILPRKKNHIKKNYSLRQCCKILRKHLILHQYQLSKMKKGKRLCKKLLLIGWDAADWQMIDPLMAAGKMPTLKKLVDNGVCGNLATIRPILSPMLWTSIATGKRADKHGIHGFLEPLPDGTNVRPVTSTSRTCKAIWNILNQSGLRSNVINWFASYPAEPINGAMVANAFSDARHNKQGSLNLPKDAIHPKELFDELVELHVRGREISPDDVRPLIPRVDEIDVTKDDKPLQLAILLAAAASTQAAATHLMETREWDFTAVYFPAVDHFGHHFIDFHPPKQPHVSEEDFERYRHVMNGCYMFHDMLLQALLKQAGEDTTVMIVSDHGFYTGELRPDPELAAKNPEIMHRHLGIACLHGPGIKHAEKKLYGATLLDITPTILTLFGLPVGLDMDGRPWTEVLEGPSKPESILSWESIDGDTGQLPPEAVSIDIEGAEEAIQQLVDLGYIEPLSEDTEKRVRKTRLDLKTNLIRALVDSTRFMEAIPLLEEMVEQEKDNEWYRLTLAECYQRGNQIENAKVHINQLSEAANQNSNVLSLRAKIAFSEKQPEKGFQYLLDALKVSPQSVSIACDLGRAYLQLKQIDKAKKSFSACLKIDPDYAFAHNGLASVCLVEERFEQAVEHALEAINLIPHFHEAHFNLGLALVKLNKTEQAITAFESCESMKFNLPVVYTFLAKLHAKDNSNRSAYYKDMLQKMKARKGVFTAYD